METSRLKRGIHPTTTRNQLQAYILFRLLFEGFLIAPEELVRRVPISSKMTHKLVETFGVVLRGLKVLCTDNKGERTSLSIQQYYILYPKQAACYTLGFIGGGVGWGEGGHEPFDTILPLPPPSKTLWRNTLSLMDGQFYTAVFVLV